MKVLGGNRSVSRKVYEEHSIWACECDQTSQSVEFLDECEDRCDSLFSIERLRNSRESSLENLIDGTQIVVSSHRCTEMEEVQ